MSTSDPNTLDGISTDMSTSAADFLVEIGTEELPPKALRRLMSSFAEGIGKQLEEHRLAHDGIKAYASPRRIAAIVNGLQLAQEDREVEAKGPPVRIAFDDDGKPQPAALAFAKKCGVDVADLQRVATDKGEWLTYTAVESGVTASDVLPGIVDLALQNLPIPRRMRWGASDAEFVRPVHWVLMLHGSSVVPATIMGHAASNVTRGHRFMSDGDITISAPSEWLAALEGEGFVVADFDKRQQSVIDQVTSAAADAGGTVAAPDALYEEVAALTEWPVAMTGRFDEAFLDLPAEVIIASLTGHQRYFPIVDKDGSLLPAFVVVANLDSKQPDRVRDGNERVLRPRLSDAAFFWDADQKVGLDERRGKLERVVYQKGLGSMKDKSDRVEKLCIALAEAVGVDATDASRAAVLSKADLLTGMVGEFPELQGVMGAYYARAQGESDGVASAIGDQYRPRFAGDDLPNTSSGQLLALADKLDTLAGIFALGKKPSGNKDPFGLRRAALGVVRILVECELEVRLLDAVVMAVDLQPTGEDKDDSLSGSLFDYIVDRLRGYYIERPEISIEMFESVIQAADRSTMVLPDFELRLNAVKTFASMAEADSLAAANKRISNMLQQSEISGVEVDVTLLTEEAEITLSSALESALTDVRPLQDCRDYAAVLRRLADLRVPVDRFFDEVMVMVDDEKIRQNRLALLSRLSAPFRSVADISRLSSAKKQG